MGPKTIGILERDAWVFAHKITQIQKNSFKYIESTFRKKKKKVNSETVSAKMV